MPHPQPDHEFTVRGVVTADTGKDLIEELRKACPALSPRLEALTLAHEILRDLKSHELLELLPDGDDPRLGLMATRLVRWKAIARTL